MIPEWCKKIGDAALLIFFNAVLVPKSTVAYNPSRVPHVISLSVFPSVVNSTVCSPRKRWNKVCR